MPSIEWNKQRWTTSLIRYTQQQEGPYGDQWGTPETLPALQTVIDAWLLPFVGPEKTIIEIGPGGGRWTHHLLNARALHCVDVNQVMLDYIVQRFHKPANLYPYLTGGTDLPALPNGSVDFVFSFGTFVHIDIPDIVAYLDNIRPLLADGADVILQYADKTKPSAAQNIHFAETNPVLMESLLCAHGYRVIRHETGLIHHSNIIHVRPAPPMPQPFPLATEDTVRILAWPDYRDAAELLGLFKTYAPAIAAVPGATLCLRVDPRQDIAPEQALQLLNEAFSLTTPDLQLNVLVIDNDISPQDWARLGSAVTATIDLPSSSFGPRAAFSSALRVPRIRTPEEIPRLLPS